MVIEAANGDGGLECGIRIGVEPQRDVPVLVAAGILSSSTYLTLRDAVIKAAVDDPPAVIVDVDRLSSPSPSAWTVLTSARWHVSIWPDVKILLVCAHSGNRRALVTSGINRYLPIHRTREAALGAVHTQALRARERVRTDLPRSREGIELARDVVTYWLSNWDLRGVLPAVATVATALVENVLDHTQSAPGLIVEKYRDTVAVAVEDNTSSLPVRHEDVSRGVDAVSGLAIVSALCRAWGSAPTSSGKTVWAVIGQESQF